MPLGTELPILYELIHQIRQQRHEKSCAASTSHRSDPVLTRSQATKQGLEALPDLGRALLQGTHKGHWKSKSHYHLEKNRGAPLSAGVSVLRTTEEWQVPEIIRELQRADTFVCEG